MGARGRRGLSLGAIAVALFAGACSATAQAADSYLDCSAAADGDGSSVAPRNTVGLFTLGPGDRLLLKRGTTCAGELLIRGGGTVDQPSEVGAYGEGAAPKVVGNGQDAVRVENVSNLELRDLDVSNPGSGEPLGEATTVRNGVRVIAQSQVARGLSITGLKVHDVAGDLTKSVGGSAAIQLAAGGPGGRFDGLRVSGNRIDSVSRSAISIYGTDDMNRPKADQPWPTASTGIVIEDNRIDLVAGDGIVTRGSDGTVIEGNVVSRGNLSGRPILDPAGPMCNAGIWAFRANNTIVRGNEVFGMEHNGCDGTGFDVDYRQDGTVIEGNYSHDNEGGFVLLCTDQETHRADVRFNLSVNDGTMINHGPCGLADGIFGDLSGIRMFNNTVVGASPTVSIQLTSSSEMYEPGDFLFANNLVYARQRIEAIACGERCTNNAFFGLPRSGTNAVTVDPLLTGPLLGGEGLATAAGYKLKADSPLRGTGVVIAEAGDRDFFDNALSPGEPAIGFDQTPAEPGPGPDDRCLRAKAAQKRAKKGATAAARRLKKLRKKRASRARVRAAARKLNRSRRQVRRSAAEVRRACST